MLDGSWGLHGLKGLFPFCISMTMRVEIDFWYQGFRGWEPAIQNVCLRFGGNSI